MSKGIGRLFQLGIAKETVRGTPESAAGYWIPFSEMSIEERDQKIADEQAYGVIEDSIGMSIITKWAQGNFKAPIGDKHFPLVLLAALGNLSSALHSGETLVYDHTITVQQSARHQALSLFLDDPLGGQDYKHALGVIESLEISYEMGQFLSYTANVKARRGATASLSPANVTENRFLPKHVTFKTASNLAGLAGATPIQIKMLSLKIDASVEDDYVLGNEQPVDFLNKQFMVEGQFEATWTDESLKSIALAGTPQALRIDLVSDQVIGTAANPQLQIDLAKCTFTEITRAIKINDVVMQTIAFKAHYSISDSKMITIKAVNTVSSY